MKALKNYLKNLYLKLSGIYLARYYSDLDEMPIGSFTAVMSGSIASTSRNKFYDVQRATRAWEKLFNKHLAAYGLPKAYTDYMSRMDKAHKHYDLAYNGGKKWLIVKAKLYEHEAKQLLSGEGESIDLTCARISKFVGFPVKASTCSVTEFHSYADLMSK